MTLAEPPVAPPTESLAGELTSLGREAGERATLLQFSTAFCAPCRTTRTVLADVARIVPGVAHVEVDAEDNLELVRQLGIRRTPTVLVLDGHAREISRASGAPPSRAAVIAALGPVATESEPMEP
ncbi:thiol reductase thioredoxin [Pseudofrankia sp. BMG5.36]|nr:thiol reductase thioredoxin [Pseudofrankia sp. BMG5.36]